MVTEFEIHYGVLEVQAALDGPWINQLDRESLSYHTIILNT